MTRRVRSAAALVIASVLACLLSGCNARSEYDAPLVGKDDLERLAVEAGLTEEQRASAERLVDDYTAEHAAALKKMQDYRAAFDTLVDRGETPEIRADYNDTTARYERYCRSLRDRFLEDARTLLTPEQLPGWERYARWHRRKTLAPKGVLHGESVDIVRLVESLTPPAAHRPAVAETLSAYSVDFDAALLSRQEAIAALQRIGPDDPGQRGRAEARVREQRARVRRLNFAFAQRVKGELEAGLQTGFEREFERAAFPEVFGDGEIVDAVFAEVRGLEDLTERQKMEVAAVKAWYLSERPAVDRPWAAAIKAVEDDEPVRVESGPEGQGRQPARVAEARRPRQALDLRCRARLEGILTSSQLDRLPWLPQKPRLPRVEFE